MNVGINPFGMIAQFLVNEKYTLTAVAHPKFFQGGGPGPQNRKMSKKVLKFSHFRTKIGHFLSKIGHF